MIRKWIAENNIAQARVRSGLVLHAAVEANPLPLWTVGAKLIGLAAKLAAPLGYIATIHDDSTAHRFSAKSLKPVHFIPLLFGH